MRICLLAEGCYPYVAGGVSSWIQMLIEGMPQHEFVIFAIGAESSLRGKYKYEIPKNVVEIKEVFLDEFNSIKNSKFSKITVPEETCNQITNILVGNKVNWEPIFDVIINESKFNVDTFLKSRDFMTIIEKISQHEYKNTAFSSIFWSVRSMLMPLIDLLKIEAPEADIYHTVATGYAGIIGAKFKWETKKKLIVTEHGIYSREREEEILKADWVEPSLKSVWINFFKRLSEGAYDAADSITSLFQSAKNIQIELGADSSKCITIPNGVDINRFDFVNKIDTKADKFLIGAIVRVVPIKDIKTLIYSFDIVKKKIPNAELLIIGPFDEDKEYYNECIEIIEQLKCEGIKFTGRINIADVMNDLDVIVLTSISEGQPFVLLEAMSAQRPVVATDVGSCREIIEGNDEFGHCGFVAQVMNPESIARDLIKLGRDRRLMKDFAEEGYERVKKYYSREDFLISYENLYKEVVK